MEKQDWTEEQKLSNEFLDVAISLLRTIKKAENLQPKAGNNIAEMVAMGDVAFWASNESADIAASWEAGLGGSFRQIEETSGESWEYSEEPEELESILRPTMEELAEAIKKMNSCTASGDAEEDRARILNMLHAAWFCLNQAENIGGW